MRIRTIKPEFYRSEDIAALDWDVRLVFIGLWSYVDDNGVGRDSERLIVADLFPLDDPRECLASVSRALQTLFASSLITRYTLDGRPYLYINTWDKHQKIDRPNKERYKPPTCENAIIRDTLATSSRGLQPNVASGAVEQWSSGAVEVKTSSPTPLVHPSFDEFWDLYPRKVGKLAAQKAYVKAVRLAGADVVLAGVARLANDPNLPKDRTLIPHANTWLNGGRWADEPYPSSDRSQRGEPRYFNSAPNQMRIEI